jgi:sulfite exporter TauE/SafE
MSIVPGISNTYLGAFVGGLFYGLAFCTSACLPYVASYIAGIGAGFRRGITITLAYNSGRIIAYAVIGAAIAVLSGTFRFLFSEVSLLPFQQYSSLAFGIVTIAIGTMILLHSRRLTCTHATQGNIIQGSGKLGRRFDLGAFSLGLSRGLVICPALLALLVYSLPFSTPIDSFSLAVLFGMGTALSPLLILGGATGWLLNKAPLFRKWISRFGGLILIVLGAVSIWMAATAGST